MHADGNMVLDEVRLLGGSATPRELGLRVPLSRRTLARRLNDLVASGELVRRGHGQYALRDRADPRLPERGREIVDVLRREGVDAHLTGLDVLAGYVHQFMFDYPHVVYAEPYALDAAEAVLADNGFAVVSAAPGGDVQVPDPSRLVLLRKQADAARRFGVVEHVAPREKAWVDLLREATKGRMDFDFGELGRLLRALQDAGADAERLRRYAARIGYERWLDAVDGAQAPRERDIERLVAGYRSP
jgi:hypothetical protein